MATFKICVFDHQQRRDGKYPVSIRVCWKRQYGYIKTEYYVTEKQISRKKYLTEKGKKKETITLKDIFIINELNNRILKFEEIKTQKLGYRIEMYSARELAEFLKNETKPGSDSNINFVDFSRRYAAKMIAQERTATAGNLTRTLNALIDYCNGREKIAITEITAKFLEGFEAYLKSERTIKRKNQYDRMVVTKKKGIGDISLYDYMNDIRVLFNEAIKEYNDEDKGEIRIFHYPFRKYKLKRRPDNEKRNISREQIIAIRDIEDSKISLERGVFARDVFMLSFYLVGMNLADMYDAERCIDASETIRIEYNRKKTRGRRQDRALISIRVEPEALALFEKYRDPSGNRVFDFYKRYSTSHIFSSNVNKGLKVVAKCVGIPDIPLSTYYARHSWATIARNKCGISRDDIDLALNHVDNGRKMADVYIEKDWSMIDTANRKVMDYLL